MAAPLVQGSQEAFSRGTRLTEVNAVVLYELPPGLLHAGSRRMRLGQCFWIDVYPTVVPHGAGLFGLWVLPPLGHKTSFHNPCG